MNSVANVAHRARDNVNSKFLATLRDTGNMTASCMVAGVSRTEMYRRRDADTELRTEWEAAIEVSVDKLELVARSRAIKGVKEPVYYKGEVVGEIHKPSDRLMELLLKAHRPDKFNPVQKLEHSGGVSVAIMQFSAPGAGSEAPRDDVIEHDVSPRVSSSVAEGEAQSASLPVLEGGAFHSDPTPKLAATQNDEGPRVANFSNLKPE